MRMLTWVEISSDALKHNLEVLSPKGATKIMAVVKANAYGHGLCECARIALEGGADCLGVFSAQEGIILRERGIDAPVVVLGFVLPDLFPALRERNLSFCISSLQQLKALTDFSGDFNIHLKFDTGLRRLGFAPGEIEEILAVLEGCPTVHIEGLFTHFANIEDTINHDFAKSQLALFQQMCVPFMERYHPTRHCACSAAALLFPQTFFEMVRTGISLYGMWPSKETLITALLEKRKTDILRPVMTWKTRIAQVKYVMPGDTVGYGCSHHVTRPGKIAVLPVGYADGYDRSFSNRSQVLIGGEEAPIIGRICMNMCMADVSHIEHAAMGDEVVLLGRQKEKEISADYLAGIAATINYEITTRINGDLPRIVV